MAPTESVLFALLCSPHILPHEHREIVSDIHLHACDNPVERIDDLVYRAHVAERLFLPHAVFVLVQSRFFSFNRRKNVALLIPNCFVATSIEILLFL